MCTSTALTSRLPPIRRGWPGKFQTATSASADGLILILPSDRADVRMQMFNADGSEAEMCGNGIRCVAKYAYEHGLVHKPTVSIETLSGVLPVELDVVDGSVEQVTVEMGTPNVEAGRIPVALSQGEVAERLVDLPLNKYISLSTLPAAPHNWMEECELDGRMTCVSMGNPHLVIYCGSVAGVPLKHVGPFLETQPIFPQRINVHFVQVQSPREVTMRTWERGSGTTLACGTGACAVCVAGVLTARTERRLLAHLPGGDLKLHWDETTGHVRMTGPAVEVFSGEWNPSKKAEVGSRMSEVGKSKVESQTSK